MLGCGGARHVGKIDLLDRGDRVRRDLGDGEPQGQRHWLSRRRQFKHRAKGSREKHGSKAGS